MGYIWGSFSGVGTGIARPYIVYSFSQNQAENYTDVTATLYFANYSSYYAFYNNSGDAQFFSNINGSYSTTYGNFSLTKSNGIYIRSRTVRVYHNADGTKSCWIGFYGSTYDWSTPDDTAQLNYYNFGATITLPTIPKNCYNDASVNFTIGNSLNLNIVNPTGMYFIIQMLANGIDDPTHKIFEQAYLNTEYGTKTITLTEAQRNMLYSLIPNSTSIPITIGVYTTSDAGYTNFLHRGNDARIDSIGTASIDQTACKPTFTTYTIANVDEALANTDKYANVLTTQNTNTLTGSSAKFIKGYNKIRATILAANKMVALNYATAVDYVFASWILSTTASYSAGSTVTIDIDDTILNDFNLTARDSRVLGTAVPSTMTAMADYYTPSVFNMTLTRDNNVDAPVKLAFGGQFWKYYFGGGTSGVLNAITCHYRYKETTEAWGAQTWNAITPTSDGAGVVSFDDYINGDLGASGFDTDKSYNIEVRIYDKLGNMIIEGILDRGKPLLDWTQDGMAINDKYDPDLGGSFQVDGDVFTPATVLKSDFARQALINGNFDVWQRNTTGSVTDATTLYVADRWWDYASKDGGTLPTLTRSRQSLTPGDILGSFFYTRLATNGAGSSLGANSFHYHIQRIEGGTKYLCGLGKQITVSFYARSSIANKKLGLFLIQNYGSGGSPSSDEVINGTNVTLTSSWVKYTYTFTTNTIAGKTFGTALDDRLELDFVYMWGSSKKTPVGAAGAETYVGSGNIDIAQVQVSVGDIAPDFQPRTFQEEFALCQRYFWTSYNYGVAIGSAYVCEANTIYGRGANTSDIDWLNAVHPRMRLTPSGGAVVTYYAYDGTAGKVSAVDGTSSIGGTLTTSRAGDIIVCRMHSSTAVFTAGNFYYCGMAISAEF